MVNDFKIIGATTLLAVGLIGSAAAQTTPPAPATQPAGAQTTATGKPLEMRSQEGFWGHVNPFARKKWVHRQVDPLNDRVGELNELSGKNSRDIRDVDSRATAGINKAMTTANGADANATAATERASQANSSAVSSQARTSALNGTVANLDQYHAITSAAVNFIPGHTSLSAKAKANLDEIATRIATEKGYIVEIQGYSRAGLTQSQAMADTVARYLVLQHQVPVYRIYRTAMGKEAQVNNQTATVTGQKLISNGVRITVLENSLATLDSDKPTPTTTNAAGATISMN